VPGNAHVKVIGVGTTFRRANAVASKGWLAGISRARRSDKRPIVNKGPATVAATLQEEQKEEPEGAQWLHVDCDDGYRC
jgi:hypothetical protein